MSLDYGHTCPDIDRSIDRFKSDIGYYLGNMLDDCCPLLAGRQRDDLIESYMDQMYKDFEANFEDVRKTNEDMRKEADYQIGYAEDKLAEAEQEIEDLNEQIDLMRDQHN